jgi:tyrosine-protein kinase Etk/Wzc
MNEPISKQTLNTGPSQQNGEGVPLSAYLDILIGSRWLIASVTLIVALAGIAYAVVATPIYQANLLVQVEDNASPTQNVLGDLAGAFDLKSQATAEIEILRSRMVVSRAVSNAQLDLSIRPKYFPFIGRWVARSSEGLSRPGLFGLGGYVWGRERAEIDSFVIPASLEGEPFILTALGNNSYHLTQADAGIEITGKVGVPVKHQTSQGAVEIAVGQLLGNPGARFIVDRSPTIDTIEQLQKKLSIAEKGKQSGIIGVTLEGPDPAKTAATLNEIGKEYVRQNVERKSAEAQKSLDFLEKQLPVMKAQLEQAEAKYNALRNSRGTVDLSEEAKSILQQSVLSQARLIELKQKRDELLTRFQETNPLVQGVTQQMHTITNEIDSVNRQIRKMPSIEQDVLRLTRDVKVETDLYTSLLNSAQQLRLVKASKVGNVRLLDQAVPPLHPVRPQRRLIIFAAVLLGLAAGVIGALIKRSLFGGIEDPHEIEDALGLTVSAAIPHSEKQVSLFAQLQARVKKLTVLAIEDPADGAIEALRSFRTSLQFSLLSAKNKIVMITGPTPGVGKSFVSVNFAVVLAATGKRVLLIDGDIRKGYLHSYFGLDRKHGLSEVIVGQLSKEDVVHKAVVENLDFISTGVLPPRPAELLGHENFAQILESAGAQYDYVVIDTAPILAVTDALVVAPHAGTIFNIVRGDISTMGEVEESVKRLNQAGNMIAGVVFNGVRPRMGAYRYGSKYGKYRYAQYKY